MPALGERAVPLTEATVDISLCVPVYRRHGPPNLETLVADFPHALAGLRGELLVVLNGIAPGDAGLPATLEAAARFEQNAGVPAAWNRAAAGAAGDVLCFSNDDVRLGDGSLRRLWQALRDEPAAGVVGPVGTRWDIDVATHLSWISLEGLGPGETRECEVVSGFLFATPRHVFARSGGFDEAYTPCGFEEVDYCTTVRRKLGLRCLAVAGVAHEHEFGVSARRPWHRVRFNGRSESIRSIASRNRRHFLSKWSVSRP